MSEQKNHNDINLDDEFLNLDFGNQTDSLNLESSANALPTNETVIDTSLEADIFGDAALDLSAIDTPSTPTDSASSEDDFLHQLDLLNQPNQAPNNITGAEVAAAAATVAAASMMNQPSDANKAAATEQPVPTPEPIPNKKSKFSKPVKPSSKDDIGNLLNNPKKLNKLILGGVVALLLIGIALYMTTKNSEEPSVVAPTPAPAASTPPEPVAQPAAEAAPPASAAASAVASTSVAADDSVVPDIKPVVNPDEILNAEIPSDPALIKEEIDRLADKNSRIAEQEKLITEQLTMMEDLTTAKAEQIALLEAQIAELEKQKGNASGQK